MKVRALPGSLVTVLALCLSSPAWAGYVLAVDAPAFGSVGDSVDVNVNLSTTNIVTSIDFQLAYDPARMTFTGGSAGPLLPASDRITVFGPPAVGLIRLNSFGLGLLPAGSDGVIGVFQFDLIAAGDWTFGIVDPVLGDELLNTSLGGTTTTASIAISNNVPCPASVLLVGLGVAGLDAPQRCDAATGDAG